MVSVFIPIYLLTLGYGLKDVALFFMVQCLTRIFLAIPAAKWGSVFGFKRMYLLSLIPFTAYLYLVATLGHHSVPLPVLAILAETAVCYWLWHHIFMAKHTKDGSRNSQIVVVFTFESIAAVIGPILGGFILKVFGMEVLIAFLFCLLLFSAWGMKFVEDHAEDFSLKVFSRDVRRISYREYMLFSRRGFSSLMTHTVWPIIIFLSFISDYVLLGTALSVAAFFAVFAGHFASGAFDKNEVFGLKLSSATMSAIWVVRLFIAGPLGVFLTNAVEGVMNKIAKVSTNAYCYTNASKISLVNYTVVREIGHNAGAFVLAFLLYFIVDWIDVIPLAIISNALLLLL